MATTFDKVIGFRGTAIFVAQNLRYFTQKFILANFCASFALESEQLLRNIPHCSASHATSFVQKSKLRKMICKICSKIKIAQSNLRKEQNCAKFLASKNKIAQEATFFAKTKSYS